MVAKIYANENFPQPTVAALRELGHDVLTTLDSGKAGQAISDEDVLAFANDMGRILVTLNRKHFIRLHNDGHKHQGSIACTFDANFSALAQRIHAILEVQKNMTGQLIRVNRPT